MTLAKLRHENDLYETLPRELEFLMEHVKLDLSSTILEPCAGNGAISNPLRDAGYRVITNDITPGHDFCLDLTDVSSWDAFGRVDWVWMNPPFKHAAFFVQQAHRIARLGVICYLRLTFLEPCENRAAFLLDHPVNKLLVLPRSSYREEGTSSDTVTRAWFVWDNTSSIDKIRFLPSEKVLQRIGRG